MRLPVAVCVPVQLLGSELCVERGGRETEKGGRVSREQQQGWRLQPCQFSLQRWTDDEKRGTMALSLSADEEDYDSESEQVREQNISHVGFLICILFCLSRGGGGGALDQ